MTDKPKPMARRHVGEVVIEQESELGRIQAELDALRKVLAGAADEGRPVFDPDEVVKATLADLVEVVLGERAEYLDAATRPRAELAEARRERDHLAECMRIAGLQCFMRGESPASVAEHLQRISDSWGRDIASLTTERDTMAAELAESRARIADLVEDLLAQRAECCDDAMHLRAAAKPKPSDEPVPGYATLARESLGNPARRVYIGGEGWVTRERVLELADDIRGGDPYPWAEVTEYGDLAEAAPARDESGPAPGWTVCDEARGKYIRDGGLTDKAGTWLTYDEEHGYAPPDEAATRYARSRLLDEVVVVTRDEERRQAEWDIAAELRRAGYLGAVVDAIERGDYSKNRTEGVPR